MPGINFEDYLLRNEKWLSNRNEAPGTHKTDGKLDDSEISVFFSSSHIEIGSDSANDSIISADEFNNWYESNESAIRDYFDSIGVAYNNNSKKELLDSMLDFMDDNSEVIAKTQKSKDINKTGFNNGLSKDLFDSNVNLTFTQVNDGTTMPYLLIAPENVDPNKEMPVLFYLHGLGTVGKSLNTIENSMTSPAGIMKEWELDNFNGYIICPLLQYGNWSNKNAENQLRNLYETFTATHKVDADNVGLMGFSLGAQGALYMGSEMSDIFTKSVAISPYNPYAPSELSVETKAFVGSNDDPASKKYATGTLQNIIGEENVEILEGQTHKTMPQTLLNIDKDGNGASDILEWLFGNDNTGVKLTDIDTSELVDLRNNIFMDNTPIALSDNIQNVNWEDYGYNAETGQKFADAAEGVKARLQAKGIKTSGNCLGGVKDTFIEVTGESPFGNPGQGITVASQCITVMENNENYREITGINRYDLRYLPAGAIVVWSSSTYGENPADKYGHISISLGDGRESSAGVVNQYFSVGKNGIPRVFIPIN